MRLALPFGSELRCGVARRFLANRSNRSLRFRRSQHAGTLRQTVGLIDAVLVESQFPTIRPSPSLICIQHWANLARHHSCTVFGRVSEPLLEGLMNKANIGT